LLLTGLLLTALLLLATLTGLWLTALLLLTTLLLATLLTRLLVWILIHRSFLSNIGSPLRSLVFRGRSQSAASAFRSTIHIEVMCLELVFTCRVPLSRRTDMGRYMLLWLIGVPIPILVLIWLFGGLH
jgi:hypothetical protein